MTLDARYALEDGVLVFYDHVSDPCVACGGLGGACASCSGTGLGPSVEKQIHASPTAGFVYVRLPDRVHFFTHGALDDMIVWAQRYNETQTTPYRAEVHEISDVTTANLVLDDRSQIASLIP